MTGVLTTAIKIHTGMLRAIRTKNPAIGRLNIKTGITFTSIPDTTGGLITGDTTIPENMSGVLFITATTTGIGR
jgi:hypothetical protein